jgi:DNA/RNA endonuclease YhcR with UshA esterase domain
MVADCQSRLGSRRFACRSFLIANHSKSRSMFCMRVYFLIFALLILALRSSADLTDNTSPAKIGTDEAKDFYGREMIVTGTVAQVSIRPKIVFLNMDKPYPDSPFTLVIFPAATNKFGNLKSLKGASVEVTGVITNYHDRAEIVLEKASQLKVTSPSPAKTPGQ